MVDLLMTLLNDESVRDGCDESHKGYDDIVMPKGVKPSLVNATAV